MGRSIEAVKEEMGGNDGEKKEDAEVMQMNLSHLRQQAQVAQKGMKFPSQAA